MLKFNVDKLQRMCGRGRYLVNSKLAQAAMGVHISHGRYDQGYAISCSLYDPVEHNYLLFIDSKGRLDEAIGREADKKCELIQKLFEGLPA